MPGNRKVRTAIVIFGVVAIAFAIGQIDIAVRSIRMELGWIGRSIYEARARNGAWPERIADLEGTEYLKLPERRTLLEQGLFVIVWPGNLDPKAEANRERILAYDAKSMLSRFGRVWVCRGDLSVEWMRSADVHGRLNGPAR